MKKLGLLGGTSWHSTVEYYSYINQKVNEHFGNNTNPPLLLHNLNQQEIHRLQEEGKWDEISDIYIEAGKKLLATGVEGLMFCANTPHKVYEVVSAEFDIPWLHIADATGKEIVARKLNKVGFIGTKFSMQEDFLKSRLKKKFNIETIVPATDSEISELHRLIFDELTFGIIKDDTRAFVLDVIQKMKENGAEGVILGCTEFPLLITQEHLDIPAFNTTLLHAQYAVDFILDKE